MRVPNADRAVISAEKLTSYLLNLDHKRGRAKARVFLSFGYSQQNWQVLEMDLRQQHLTQDVSQIADTEYGIRYEIHAPLLTPSRRKLIVRSIWQIDTGTDVPRLITMYPD